MTVKIAVASGIVAFVAAISTIAVPSELADLSVVTLGSHAGPQRYELRNNTDKAVPYAHWFGSGPSPVPYCRSSENQIRICAKKVVVNPEGEPWEHESYLAGGKSVHFEAFPTSGEVVGVKSWVHGAERFIWGGPGS